MEVISVIAGIFKFWDQVVWLIKLLQKTPAEKHQELMVKMQKEANEYEKIGSRPQW